MRLEVSQIRAIVASAILVLYSIKAFVIEVYADNFDASHDYSGGNVSGTIWNGVLFNSGYVGTQNATLITANANTTNAGQFTVTSQNAGWDANTDNGFALYRNTAGDFEATVQVISATVQDYNDLGLIARVANQSDAGTGEDYVLLRYFAGFGYMGTRDIDNNVQTDFSFSGGMRPFLKLQRAGNVFTFTMANDAGFTQAVLTRSITRNDFAGLSLQVGIWSGGFIANTNMATLENFSLSVVPEPSSLILGMLSAIAAGFTANRRKNSLRNIEIDIS